MTMTTTMAMTTTKKHAKGFTLMEVLIVVAILGIISAIAIPSYSNFVSKGKRVDAKVELLKIAQLQESFFVQNLTYANSLNTQVNGSGLGLGVAGTTVQSEGEEYNITLVSLNAAGAACTGLTANACVSYTLTATPQGSQAKDKCENFTLTSTGVKGVVGTAGAGSSYTIKKCWN